MTDEVTPRGVAEVAAQFLEPGQCMREFCGNPASAVPKFTFRAAPSGPDVQMLVRLRLCDRHRPWFMEAGAQELLSDGIDNEGKPRAGLARIVAAAGVHVNPALTTWELVPLSGGGR